MDHVMYSVCWGHLLVLRFCFVFLCLSQRKLKQIDSSSQLSSCSWSMLYTFEENCWRRRKRALLDDLCPAHNPMHKLYVPQPNVIINGVIFLASFSKSSIWCMANSVLADGRWCNIDWWLRKAIGDGMPHHWHGTECCHDYAICQHFFLTMSAQGWPSLNWYFQKEKKCRLKHPSSLQALLNCSNAHKCLAIFFSLYFMGSLQNITHAVLFIFR